MRLATAISAALILAAPASAQEVPELVTQWYSALRKGDPADFERLMTEEAQVEIRQSGVTRSRAEFIASLPDWAQIAKEGEILIRPVSAAEGSAVVEVCYSFPGAERMNRESFTLAGGKIARLVQEEAGTSCPGF